MFASPVERDAEQLPAEPASALVRTEVHALQLDPAVTEVAQRDRADDVRVVERDPQCRVRRLRIVEVGVELRIGLEAELAQRLRDQRAKAVCVRGLERNDRYGAAGSSRYSYTSR